MLLVGPFQLSILCDSVCVIPATSGCSACLQWWGWGNAHVHVCEHICLPLEKLKLSGEHVGELAGSCKEWGHQAGKIQMQEYSNQKKLDPFELTEVEPRAERGC